MRGIIRIVNIKMRVSVYAVSRSALLASSSLKINNSDEYFMVATAKSGSVL